MVQAERVAECDRLAAHADDLQKAGAPGIADENIDAAKAIPACSDASAANPMIARLRFQLGRSYWSAERFEEAIDAFFDAAKLGHGGALAYLGDVALYGVSGMEPDPETAKKLYEQAASAGFKPAAALAQEIVAGATPVEESEAASEPEYHYQKTVEAFSQGKTYFDASLPPGAAFLYTTFSLRGVEEACPGAVPKGTDVDSLFEAAIQKRLQPLEVKRLLELDAQGHLELLKEAGSDDGYAVAYSKGCQAQETRTFVKTALGLFN